MKFINRLKIKAWQATKPDLTKEQKCPICGSKLYMRESEKEKYLVAMGNLTLFLSKAHDPKSMFMHLIKHPPKGVNPYWMCSNDDCEFNGDDDGKPEKAIPNGSEK